MIRNHDYASVCLLSYNRPDLVRQTISSLLRNAGRPLELIVHDDGSDTDTRQVLEELHSNGLISLLMLNAPGQNEGQGIALNRMFAAATGDPIVKMDHDLILEPDWLANCIELLEANEDPNTLYAERPRIGALGLFKYDHEPVDHRKTLLAKHITDEIPWEEHTDFVGSCMVIPRRSYEMFGPFTTRSSAFAEDAIFKQDINEATNWCCALFPDDLAQNVGFGLGPSTVNIPAPDGGIEVQTIHNGPLIIDLDD